MRPGGAVYSATKHAVRVISEGLRQEVKPYNIRSTIISPGAVPTQSTTQPVCAFVTIPITLDKLIDRLPDVG